MAKKYSDIIGVTSGRAAYNIIDEHSGEWDGFIVNKRFDEILDQCVIPSVRNNNQAVHKPFWINGTYGSGKSHASAVIMHLLCDDVEDIKPFVEREYRDNEYMRESILSLRERKRLMPVCLYGLQNMVHEADLSLCVQAAVTKSLQKVGLSLNVKTDVQCYLDSVNTIPEVWQSLIEGDARLKALAPTVDSLKHKLGGINLGNADIDVDLIEAMRSALREKKLGAQLDSAKLSDWLFEMQDALRAAAPQYNGFLIVWDEFTAVMQSAVGLNVLVPLQEIAEKMSNPANDSYLLIIAHPSALNNIDEQEKKKTSGRYHYQNYNMETISAFKIMSRMFAPKDAAAIENDAHDFFDKIDDTIKYYVGSVNGKLGSQRDLFSLFPLHPGTANLASCFATLAGSQSRSVFEFITSPAVKAFLDSEEAYERRDVITADIMWDFVLPAFKEDYNTFGVVTDKFSNYAKQVGEAGSAVAAVFKGILLLNALAKKDDANPAVVPSEVNVRHLFAGSRYADKIDDALAYIRDKQIVQRDPSGIYSVQFAALDPKEVENAANELSQTTFRTTKSIACYDGVAHRGFDMLTRRVLRPRHIAFFSAEVQNPQQFYGQIETEFAKVAPSCLRIAVLLSSKTEEREHAKEYAAKASADPKFSTVIFIVCETELGDDKRRQFLNYMANYQCANGHGLKQNAEASRTNAVLIVDDWMNRIKVSMFTWYLQGERNLESFGQLTSVLNKLSGKIYYMGPDALSYPYTTQMWEPRNAKKTALTVISGNSLADINQKLGGGPAKIASLMLHGAVNEQLQLKDGLESHPLAEAKKFVDKQIANIKCGEDFNLGDILVPLTLPPYGFYKCPAYMGMIAYIMRDYDEKLYDSKGQPHDKVELSDDISEMFEAWEKGVRSGKLQFSQESSEARGLSSLISEVFGLKEAKSLKDARWGLKDFCNKKGFPLWILSSAPDVKPDEVRRLIDGLADIQQNDQLAKDTARMASTLQLFEKFRFELSNALSGDESFRVGFNAYAKSCDGEIEESDLDSVYDYVKRNMEGEAGLWSREKLKEVISGWRGWKKKEDIRRQEENLASLISDVFGFAGCQSLYDVGDSLRSYCNEKGFPLWTLKYAPGVDSEELKKLIDSLSSIMGKPVCDSEMVAGTAGLINDCREALTKVLSDGDSFRHGFDAFVKNIDGVNITPDEVDSVYDYVKANLQPETCDWDPTSVENKVLKWRMPPTPLPIPSDDRKQKAVKKLDSLSDEVLRSLLTQMCKQGDATAIDLILKS
ncbi:MAG: hypothetical protein ACI35Q_03930 [Marinilabiliaceae bacterium]